MKYLNLCFFNQAQMLGTAQYKRLMLKNLSFHGFQRRIYNEHKTTLLIDILS